MAESLSSLSFKGSIAEAIAEAKNQRKLFVVYISGDDAESDSLKNCTWTESKVAESISKYCILLHIAEGTTDAANFSAIYPQKAVPSITAIGYNGVQLWQNEGFVSAEILASSLEKTWLSLHIQETTASVLTAALASKKPESHASGVSDTVPFEQGSSSSTDILSPSAAKQVQSSQADPLANSEIIKENSGFEHAVKKVNSKTGEKAPFGSADEAERGEAEQSISSTEVLKQELLNPVKVDRNSTRVAYLPSSDKDGFIARGEDLNAVDNHSKVTMMASQGIANEADKVLLEDKKAETVEDRKTDVSDFYTSKLTDVHLNIRLLNGASLQKKFSVTSTLKMVKDYVDENQASGIGPYDLAIPYPRKVFNDQDFSKTLSELDLFNRQALIVVPHHQATDHRRGGSSFQYQTNSTQDSDSTNGSNEGYFAFVKRMLSYINPFSYLGGGASSSTYEQEAQSSMWQYGPNPTLQNSLRATTGPSSVYSTNQSTSGTSGSNSKSRQQTSSGFGSNIHTLRHDEDDSRFTDRNAFWNGNSTQYGGDNNGK